MMIIMVIHQPYCQQVQDDVPEPIISTTHGKVRGKLRETVYGDHYYCFDGIPYAKPPLGELRFRSPQPLDETWTGIRDCTEMPPKCTQYNIYNKRIEGSEDCLYLNIYAKKLNTDKPLPIMVFIHGGIQRGSALRSERGPDYFMMKDIILVTVGFRLGVFGFLALPESELQVSGNAGLKDILMALKWLKPNYHNFNGDSNNVTLFGHSSGAMTVHALAMSPKCEGLFHKTILMSGLVRNLVPDLDKVPYRFAKHCGYGGPEDNKNILDYLIALEAEKLCDVDIFTQTEKDQGRMYPFSATVESASVADAIITEDAWHMFANKQKWSHKIPMMLGTTSLEALESYPKIKADPKIYDLFKTHPEYMLQLDVMILCDFPTRQQLAKKLTKFHLGVKQLCAENVFDIIRLMSHGYLYHPAHRYLGSRLEHAGAPTYLYRFDFDSPDFNFFRIKKCGRGIRGVTHADDLSYMFYLPESYKLSRDSDEFKTIVRYVDIFTSFAANSDPSGERIKPLIWEPLSKDTNTYKCLNISNELSFIDWPEMEACKFWDQCYREAGLRL